MNELNLIIDKYFELDYPYYQVLMTIMFQIGPDNYADFFGLLNRAELNGNRVEINESELPEMWDSLNISDLKLV